MNKKIKILYLGFTAQLSIVAGIYELVKAILSGEYLPKDDLLLAGLFFGLGFVFLLLSFEEYKIYKEK